MINHIHAMSSYNLWINRKLYEICSKFPDEERKRDAGAFFKSIHGTLNHLLLTDRVWMGRFTGNPASYKSLDEELYSDFNRLREAREKEDQNIISWITSLKDTDLSNDLAYMSMVSPQPRKYPLWFALSHFFNHQTHHRGQITTLINQMGIDPGITDLLMLPEFQQK